MKKPFLQFTKWNFLKWLLILKDPLNLFWFHLDEHIWQLFVYSLHSFTFFHSITFVCVLIVLFECLIHSSHLSKSTLMSKSTWTQSQCQKKNGAFDDELVWLLLCACRQTTLIVLCVVSKNMKFFDTLFVVLIFLSTFSEIVTQ